jgi:hypothetical protein
MKRFYNGLKAVYGPRDSGYIPVRSKDRSTMITDHEHILNRWAEHFESVLNQPAVFDDMVLSEFRQWAEAGHLDRPPTEGEVLRAI